MSQDHFIPLNRSMAEGMSNLLITALDLLADSARPGLPDGIGETSEWLLDQTHGAGGILVSVDAMIDLYDTIHFTIDELQEWETATLTHTLHVQRLEQFRYRAT